MGKRVATPVNFSRLTAFCLQVLKGDIPSAIETHRMYFELVREHKLIPEAFGQDYTVNWAQSPLRPEFAESTYFLYKATGDSKYLEVGKALVQNLQHYARTPCGWAAIDDVRRMTHEDKMDSFVLVRRKGWKAVWRALLTKNFVALRRDHPKPGGNIQIPLSAVCRRGAAAHRAGRLRVYDRSPPAAAQSGHRAGQCGA